MGDYRNIYDAMYAKFLNFSVNSEGFFEKKKIYETLRVYLNKHGGSVSHTKKYTSSIREECLD